MRQTNFVDVTAERSTKNRVDIDKFEVGKTQAHLIPPRGCCGNLICFQEYTVVGVGTFTDQNGNQTKLAQLENGMFVAAEGIEYILE